MAAGALANRRRARKIMEQTMIKKFTVLGLACLAASATPALAKGCIKGAIVGGVAGHMAGHGKAGAAAGCVVGHHHAATKAKAAKM